MGAKLRAVLTTITNIIAAFAMIKIALIMLETVQTEWPFIMAQSTNLEMQLKREALNQVNQAELAQEFILLMIQMLLGKLPKIELKRISANLL